MKTGALVLIFAGLALSSFAQQAPSPPPDNVCAKAVTIYLDASGTMTQPVRNRGNRLPISDVAQTLLRFVNAENFLAAGDTVTVKYFGSAVRTQAENRQASVALLTQLADPGTAPATVQSLQSGDLRSLTDFARLFDDLENRIRNAPSRRQIIFIASDFAHDQLNNRGCPNDADERMENFAAAFGRIRPRLESPVGGSGEAFRRVEIAGLFAPEGDCASDNKVARQVQDALKAVGMRLYRYDEDAAEAALTINNELTGTVTAQPVTAGVIRIGADNRLPFLISNPNCVDAKVTGLQFEGGARSQKVDLDPLIVSGATREVRIEVDKVGTVWNQDVRVTPVIAAGTALNTEASSSFWMGDWIRVRRMTPYVYPRTLREGQTLVEATIERSLRAPAGLTVAGIDSGSRARLFQLGEGGGEEVYVLPFDLNSAVAARLGVTGTAATVGTTGIRLLMDDVTAVATASWPLTTSIHSSAAEVIDTAGVATLAGYVLLLLGIVWRTFSRHADSENEDQMRAFIARATKLAPGAVSLVPLFTRFGFLVVDNWMWLLTTVRAAALAIAVFFLLRGALVEGLWKRYVEPRLRPAEKAIQARRRWNTFIYVAAFLCALGILYSFFWSPAAHPPPGAPVIRGVTR